MTIVPMPAGCYWSKRHHVWHTGEDGRVTFTEEPGRMVCVDEEYRTSIDVLSARWEDGLWIRCVVTTPPSMEGREVLLNVPHDQVPALLRAAREQAADARSVPEGGAS
jgi:hypothetical protein